MNLHNKILKMRYLNELIRREATGTPKELSQKLQVSESTVYNYIESLKIEGAPIAYCNKRKTYRYLEEGNFVIIFEFKKITNKGGGGKRLWFSDIFCGESKTYKVSKAYRLEYRCFTCVKFWRYYSLMLRSDCSQSLKKTFLVRPKYSFCRIRQYRA